MAGAHYATAPWMVAFHAVAVRAACISSLLQAPAQPGTTFLSHCFIHMVCDQ